MGQGREDKSDRAGPCASAFLGIMGPSTLSVEDRGRSDSRVGGGGTPLPSCFHTHAISTIWLCTLRHAIPERYIHLRVLFQENGEESSQSVSAHSRPFPTRGIFIKEIVQNLISPSKRAVVLTVSQDFPQPEETVVGFRPRISGAPIQCLIKRDKILGEILTLNMPTPPPTALTRETTFDKSLDRMEEQERSSGIAENRPIDQPLRK